MCCNMDEPADVLPSETASHKPLTCVILPPVRHREQPNDHQQAKGGRLPGAGAKGRGLMVQQTDRVPTPRRHTPKYYRRDGTRRRSLGR